MIFVVETVLREIFSQIPDVIYNGKSYKVNYDAGGQDDMNLYLKQHKGNKTPLIWLLPGTDDNWRYGHKTERLLKLVVANNMFNKSAMNLKVFDTEIIPYLIPVFENMLKALERSGITTIVNEGRYTKNIVSNYSYANRDDSGNTTSTMAIEHWNVIFVEITVLFDSDPSKCMNHNIRF